jgi:hypothetical protein
MPKRRSLGEILADLITPSTTREPVLGPTMTVRRGRFPWSTVVYRDSRFDLRQECGDCQGSGIDPASTDHDEPDLPCASCTGTGVITLDPDTSQLSTPFWSTDTYVSIRADDNQPGGEAA